MKLTYDLRALAAEYVAQPDVRRRPDIQSWAVAARYAHKTATTIRRHLDVVEVDNGDPYFDHLSQAADVKVNGRFLVSRLNCEHPLFTPSQNVDLRIAHDVAGHIRHDLSFRPDDEVELWARTLTEIPKAAHLAWTNEFLYQTAYVAVTGSYLQRCVTLGPAARDLYRRATNRFEHCACANDPRYGHAAHCDSTEPVRK